MMVSNSTAVKRALLTSGGGGGVESAGDVKTDLGTYTQADLDAIATELNNRPREILGFRTPLEARAALLH